MKGGKGGDDEAKQEMSELLISEPEDNAADVDDDYSSEDTDDSFLSPLEQRNEKMQLKEKSAKINNSFTGPYPLDPIEFPHTDKGENTQFKNALKK